MNQPLDLDRVADAAESGESTRTVLVALAANAAGLTDVILPERNRGDVDEIPEGVRDRMSFHPVITVGEVLERALEPAREVAHVS